MEPAFCEGDHVLTFNWVLPKVGDVIVFNLSNRHPESRSAGRRIYRFPWPEGRGSLFLTSRIHSHSWHKCQGFLARNKKTLHFVQSGKTGNNWNAYWIKRIKKVSGERYYVEGDNKNMSSKVGPIRKDAIVGKVILKY